jgi:hypothetical protein
MHDSHDRRRLASRGRSIGAEKLLKLQARRAPGRRRRHTVLLGSDGGGNRAAPELREAVKVDRRRPVDVEVSELHAVDLGEAELLDLAVEASGMRSTTNITRGGRAAEF